MVWLFLHSISQRQMQDLDDQSTVDGLNKFVIRPMCKIFLVKQPARARNIPLPKAYTIPCHATDRPSASIGAPPSAISHYSQSRSFFPGALSSTPLCEGKRPGDYWLPLRYCA